MSKKTIIIFYIVAAIFVVAIVVYYRKYILPERFNDKITDMFTPKGNTQTLIYNAAIERLSRKFNAQQTKLLAAFMVAQSRLESGNYTSKVFKELNNALGYKVYKGSIYQKFDKSIGAVDGGASAQYANVQDSAREVADWIGRRKASFENVATTAQYVKAMADNKYFNTTVATIADYTASVTKFYNQNNIA